jgi:glyoxylase-like metal-dependent hydrolase (beta-lactamase superfamily II)
LAIHLKSVRMRILALVSAMLGALAVGGASLAQPAPAQPPRPPLVREGATQKISPHVYVIPDDSVPLVPNVGIIVGSRATLVVDTGLGPRNAQTVLKETAKVARGKPLYLVTTHFHPEHDLGAQAFPPEAKVIRSRDQIADIDEFGLAMADAFSQRSPLTAELLKDVQFRKADIVFSGTHRLDLGGVRVRIVAMGANHTRGDTVVLVDTDKVLFSGDVAMKPQPAFASPYSSLDRWLTSLTRLAGFRPRTIVPSHGPMGGPELIAGYRTYLTLVRDRVTALKRQGKTLDETVEVVAPEMADRYPDRGRLTGAIRAAYAEAPAPSGPPSS